MNGNMFFGWLLIAIGGLIATLSGGCGLLLGITAIQPALSGRGAGIFELLMMLGIFSGIPFSVGCLVAYAGRTLLRDNNHSNRNDVL